MSYFCIPCRYNISAHSVEFIADQNISTYWEPNSDGDIISLVIGFPQLIKLSKVFIRFDTFLPSSVELQYRSSKLWSTIYYFATDCFSTFGETSGRK